MPPRLLCSRRRDRVPERSINDLDATLTKGRSNAVLMTGHRTAAFTNLKELEKSMKNALRTRQRTFALALPLTAVLYLGAEGLDPKGTDQIVTTTAVALRLLPIAGKHPTQLHISGSLPEVALGAVAVSYPAIALVRRNGSKAAIIAVLLGGIGAFCGAVVNAFGGIDLAAAAAAHVSSDAAARLLVTNFNSGPGQTFTGVCAFSELAAPVIMGVALWRSRSWHDGALGRESR
jgi:hypothetical protein